MGLFTRRYPVRRQLEASDCGAACLQMICAWHGAERSLDEVRALTAVQATGVSLADMVDAAEQLGFEAEGLQIDPAEASDPEVQQAVELPAIAHWDGDHFVVLFELDGRGAVVGDPRLGLRRLSHQELAERWNGILLQLAPTGALQRGRATAEGPGALGTFLRGFARYRTLIGQVLLATLLLQVLALAQPLLVQRLVDRVVGDEQLGLLWAVAVGLAAIVASQAALTFLRGVALFHLSGRYALWMLARFWKRLLALPLSFFARRHRGDLLRRIEDHDRIRRILQGTALGGIFDLVALLTYSALLFAYGPAIFAIFAGGAVLYATWTFALLPRRRALDDDRFRAEAEITRLQVQMLEGVQTLKAATAEVQARATWERARLREFHAQRRIWLLDTVQEVVALGIGQGTFAAVVVYEAWLVLQGQLTLGQMMATVSVLGLAMGPLRNLLQLVHELQEVSLSLRRVQIVYGTTPEPGQPAQRLARAPSLRVEGLRFRYGGSQDRPILDGIDLDLPAGTITAIVGPSGAGKTTLALVLAGLYEPGEGRILVDGEACDPRTLRGSFGFVFQHAQVFDGTLADNIALGDAEPDPGRVRAAAEIACLHDLLALPQGLQTVIGEAGIRLSGGEQQRLQIARAVYRDPSVLFLDEATSHLDAATEREVTDALREVGRGRTLVIVAHRLSTVRHADQVVVLEAGRIVEQGTHDELILRDGAYRRLLGGQLEAVG